jgi:hypothetical protein
VKLVLAALERLALRLGRPRRFFSLSSVEVADFLGFLVGDESCSCFSLLLEIECMLRGLRSRFMTRRTHPLSSTAFTLVSSDSHSSLELLFFFTHFEHSLVSLTDFFSFHFS